MRALITGRWLQGRRKLSCRQVGKLMQRYLDGTLDDEAIAAKVAEHLDDCHRCGLEAETYRRIKASLAAGQPVLPADALDRLHDFASRLARGEEPHADDDDHEDDPPAR